jgi:dTDP-4-amino-4,6-dideoxygalactose transaminase
MNIPFVDLVGQHAEVNADVRRGLDEVFATTAFIGGPAVHEFEAAYAQLMGVRHCVGVANGTDALELALRGVGVCAGGEVIMPANTFIATAEAVARIGADPVLVDVDPVHQLIDPNLVTEAVNEKTQAIVPVHLFGQVAPVERLIPIADSFGAAIVEDAAQSQGASRFGKSAGSFGKAAGTSFYPGKNLGAAGDAGAVTTNDTDIARTVRLLGAHGSERKYEHEIVGMNSRLDTIQAVVLLAKLRRLARWNELRRVAADRYAQLLFDAPGIDVPATLDGNVDVWHLYVVRVQHRDRVLAQLSQAGVGAGIHYPTPLHLTEAFSYLRKPVGSYPITEQAAKEILSLPLYPHITAEQQERVADVLITAVRHVG